MEKRKTGVNQTKKKRNAKKDEVSLNEKREIAGKGADIYEDLSFPRTVITVATQIG